MNDHYRAAVRALTALARETEHDLPGLLASILAQVAGNLGSSYAIIASRPGSWEASDIEHLVTGTVGEDDSYLPPPMDTKLTDDKARQIKDAAWYEDMTQREIAAKFGASSSTVSDINTGKTWSWLS